MLDNHTYEKMVTFNSIVADLYSRQRSEKAIQAFLTQLKSFCFFEKGDVYIYRKEDDRIKFENFIYTGWGEELATYMKYCNLDDIVPILSVPQSIMFRSSDVFIASERKKSSYYEKVIKPCQMDYSIEGNLYYEQDGFICGFGLHRQEKHGDFTDEEMKYIQLAKPHLTNIITEICKGKSAVPENVFGNGNIQQHNMSLWVINSDFEVEETSIGGEDYISTDRNNIEGALDGICKNLASQVSKSKDPDQKEFKDHCKITIEDKSYYVDVRYDAPKEDGEKAKYSCMIYDYAGIIDNILADLKEEYGLTNREFEVLRCLVDGMNNTDIANTLFVSLSTVKKHTTIIYRKLGIEGRHQLFQSIL